MKNQTFFLGWISRTFEIPFLLIFMAFSGFAVAAQEVPASLSLMEAVEIALAENPGIRQRRYQFQAMDQVADQVSALPEPRLQLNAVNLPLDSFALDQSPMTQFQIGVSQALPYPGKLALKQGVAEQLALVGKEKVRIDRNRVKRQVKHLWWQLYYLDRSLDTINSNLELLREFSDVAETKYTVGQGLQQEVLLAYVELARLEDSKQQIEAQRRKVQASFNALLNRDAATPVVIDKEITQVLKKLKAPEFLVSQALDSKPELRQARLQIDVAEQRVALADKDYYPDFQLGAMYGWRQDRTGFASIRFSMNLPFNTEKRQDRKRDQRKFEWLAMKDQLTERQNTVAEEIHRAYADYERARTQTLIYRDQIIPQASQTVDSMLAGYQVNKVDFLNLLRSQVNLFNFQTQYWQALSMANQALASLEYAMGKEVVYEN